MPLIAKIGRKSWSSRLLIGTIYAALALGAITMVYPFLLMIAGSTKSGVDNTEFEVIPSFLKSDEELYKKDCEAFFNETMDMMKMAFDSDATSFKKMKRPATLNTKLIGAWQDFLRKSDLPAYTYTLGSLSVKTSGKCQPLNLRKFKNELGVRYNGDLNTLNSDMDTYYDNWSAFYYVPESYLIRRDTIKVDPIDVAFRDFKVKQPLSQRYYFSVDGYYKNVYLKSQYTRAIDVYNEAHGTAHTTWADVTMANRYPSDANETVRSDWAGFVRDILSLLWIRADSGATPRYQAFLKQKYLTMAAVNKMYRSNYTSFAEIPIIDVPPKGGVILSDWISFVQGWKDPVSGTKHQLPIESVYLKSVDEMFRSYLKETHGTLSASNDALGTTFKSWQHIVPPQEAAHFSNFQKTTGTLKKEYILRNYISVIDFIALHGRAIWNTTIYCGLAIMAALLINPLAAYALSRYKPPSAYKVLLFLMLTMAFPPLVTMIPQFLMLREFGFLNTFAALVLPGMANGYSIFLLKGFFDSLPQELYESAEIDGAGEFRIFWTITMALSKPILAVIALNSFNLAYSNFMMALLICQDQDMWTLMPWLFQLQRGGCQGVVFASLLIAAIPTFLIFVFCQNIIMRGIVVPVEK